MNDIEEPIAPQLAEEPPHDRNAEDEESGLRNFCARILGWADEHAGAVEHAIRSIHLSVRYRATLVLLGDTDLVPIARALHRRTLGGDRPFIVCDRRRRNLPASVRSPMNHESGVDAFQAARGGSLCIRHRRLPRDFSSVVARLRRTDDVQFIVCSDGRDDAHPFLTLPVPIRVPSLRVRASELPRIVDEYAVDAIAELRPLRPGFTAADRQWVLEHTPLSLSEIEKATLRLVAIRASRNMSGAAARLGMAPVSLSRWIGRRKQPPQFGHDQGTPEQEIENQFELGAPRNLLLGLKVRRGDGARRLDWLQRGLGRARLPPRRRQARPRSPPRPSAQLRRAAARLVSHVVVDSRCRPSDARWSHAD